MTATKAKAAAVAAAVFGFVAPGVTYLLTVDGNGITGTEWLHAALLSVGFAGAGAAAIGGAVYGSPANRPL